MGSRSDTKPANKIYRVTQQLKLKFIKKNYREKIFFMDKLFSKIHGCEAAAAIANSMGDVTEGHTYEEIEARWGFVDRLLPQNKFGPGNTLADAVRPQPYGPDYVYHAHARPAGMTEDGHERHRLCTTAIINKRGRIDIADLAKIWASDVKPEKFGYLMGPQDQIIYYSIMAGVQPWEIGRYAAWPSLIGTSKMILPVGMVNACNPDRAAQDGYDLARIKDVRGVPGNYAVEVCGAIAAACAEAMKPDATVDSIIDTALFYLSKSPREEVLQGLAWAKNADSWKDLRPIYQDRYHGFNISNAVEVLSGGLACLYISQGAPKNAILYAVNLGRDCDCRAYVAGGLAGALNGIEAIPDEWVKIIDDEVVTDPYTVSNRTTAESAKGIYDAAINTMRSMSRAADYIKLML
jgi:ADP-ribosylglycohydrolase